MAAEKTHSIHTTDTFTNDRYVELFYQSVVPQIETLQGVIVFLHGLGDHSSGYLDFFERLAEAGYAVFAFDYIGHGKSEGERVYLERSLSLSCATEHKQIAAGEKNATTFVNCHIEAPKCDDNERQPIDLVITTLTFLSRELSATDRVSLVVYDRDVTTVQPLTLMTHDGKALFEKRVRAIQAGTCTNLSGGLFAGLDEIQRHERSDGGSPNPIRSVLLLTDGLANYGVVKSLPLLSILESCYNDAPHPTEQANAPPTGRPEPSSPVSLFTFGYGDNHDAKLLR
ncbi:hypothetical protein SPRG_06931, partial [Saprolegnia parasitica CBS 223.65]